MSATDDDNIYLIDSCVHLPTQYTEHRDTWQDVIGTLDMDTATGVCLFATTTAVGVVSRIFNQPLAPGCRDQGYKYNVMNISGII